MGKEADEGFEVLGAWEEIEGDDTVYPPARLHKAFEVPGQGLRIAGNVNERVDPSRPGEPLKRKRSQSLPGRVHDPGQGPSVGLGQNLVEPFLGPGAGVAHDDGAGIEAVVRCQERALRPAADGRNDPRAKLLQHAERLQAGHDKYEQKEGRLKKEIEDLKARLAKSEAARGEALKRLEEFRSVLSDRETLLAELKMRTAEQEGELNSKYVTRMQELYEKVSKKELDLLLRWEDKNRALEARSQEFEGERAARERQLKLREKALEEEFNSRNLQNDGVRSKNISASSLSNRCCM